MITIQMKFLTGRWHATPWGRQVNEGAIEWPPAPWRILRALIAVWHHKCSDIPEEQMAELITQLTPLPAYHLPAAKQGHTRHYMPIGKDKTTKIFDTFITLDRSTPVTICWKDQTLNEEQHKILSQLLQSLSYFGRAESWIEAELVDDWKGKVNVIHAEETTTDFPTSETERVRLLATVPEAEYAPWQEDTIKQFLQNALQDEKQKASDKGKDPAKVKKLSSKKRKGIEDDIPKNLFLALHAETGDLRKAGWNRPPGSRWVDYLRPKSAFDPLPQQKQNMSSQSNSTVARYAIASNVLPKFTDALRIGERVRSILMGHSKKVEPSETSSSIFSGKEDDGSFTLGQHQHAHFLPESCDDKEKEGRISHISIFAPKGFNENEELAITRLRKVWGDGNHDLQLVLLGLGQPKDFGGLNQKAGQSPIFAESKIWNSETPFVSPHHLRIRNHENKDPENRVEATVRELYRIICKEMKNRNWLQQHSMLLEKVELMKEENTERRWVKFRRERKKGGGQKANSQGYGIRLIFKEPVRGPILLGYGCHFGLGQFVPDQ